MKHFGKLAVLGAALAVSTTSAFATPVVAGTLNYANDFNDYVVWTGTGPNITLTFGGTTNPASDVNISPLISGFDGLTPAADGGFLANPINLASPSGTIFTVTQGSGATLNTITFIVSSASETVVGGFLDVTFLGTVDETVGTGGGATVYTPYAGTLTLDTQGGANTQASYSGNLTTAPEPSSLMLLGSGLIGGAGMLMRRRRLTA